MNPFAYDSFNKCAPDLFNVADGEKCDDDVPLEKISHSIRVTCLDVADILPELFTDYMVIFYNAYNTEEGRKKIEALIKTEEDRERVEKLINNYDELERTIIYLQDDVYRRANRTLEERLAYMVSKVNKIIEFIDNHIFRPEEFIKYYYKINNTCRIAFYNITPPRFNPISAESLEKYDSNDFVWVRRDY